MKWVNWRWLVEVYQGVRRWMVRRERVEYAVKVLKEKAMEWLEVVSRMTDEEIFEHMYNGVKDEAERECFFRKFQSEYCRYKQVVMKVEGMTEARALRMFVAGYLAVSYAIMEKKLTVEEVLAAKDRIQAEIMKKVRV